MKYLHDATARGNSLWRSALLAALAAMVVSGPGRAEYDGTATPRAEAEGRALAGGRHKLVWLHDLRVGLESAKKSSKLVMIDLYTDWCGWCKKLDRDTYTDPSVLELLNSQFVCVKLDAEDGADGESFAKEHRVRGFPCIIVLEPSGKVRGVSYGYRNPQDFTELMKAIVNREPEPEVPNQ